MLRRWMTLLLVVLLSTGATMAGTVTIRLKNDPGEGELFVELYDDANAFGDLRGPLMTVSFTMNGTGVYAVTNVPPGTYAALVHHDEDGDGVLDRNFIGIPREPLAVSNDYRPKGSPRFSVAKFDVGEGGAVDQDFELYRPLGKRGRIGVGVAAIGRTSVYRDDDAGVVRVIPAVTYIGNRLQIYGPFLQVGLVGSDRFRLAANASYRIGRYEEGDSEFLDGMGDRKDTGLAGLSLAADLPGGVKTRLGYSHDVFDRIGGGTGSLGLSKSFQLGRLALTPSAGVNWLSSDMAQHDYGVPQAKATAARPAYDVGDSWSAECSLSCFYEVTPEWSVILTAGAEFLDDSARNSPIVDRDVAMQGFFAVSYLF